MKNIARVLCLLAVSSLACDDDRHVPDDRTAELPEVLLEQGWHFDGDGELVREREDGTLEHALLDELVSEHPDAQLEGGPVAHGTIDDLTAPLDPSQVIYGVWTPLVGTESCLDLFTEYCSGSVPNQQCEIGSVCEWSPGASCYSVISANSVKPLRCKK